MGIFAARRGKNRTANAATLELLTAQPSAGIRASPSIRKQAPRVERSTRGAVSAHIDRDMLLSLVAVAKSQ